METLWQDIHYGLRVLRRGPGLTLVALLSLALGIGAATAMFSVAYGVLISPYPYVKPDQIWSPDIRGTKDPMPSMRPYHLSTLLEVEKLRGFSSVMATSPEGRLLTGDHAPESFSSILVTADAFEFLGMKPLLLPKISSEIRMVRPEPGEVTKQRCRAALDGEHGGG